jgi:murein DD-endopeptidase MepM/ murein hydrolase activator NlpD
LLLAGVGGVYVHQQTKAASAKVPKAARPAGVSQSLTVSGPVELASALAGAGLPADLAARAAQAAAVALGETDGELRANLVLTSGLSPALVSMEVRRVDGSGVSITPGAGGGFASQPLADSYRTQVRVVRGEVDATSFYTSAVAAGVTDTLIPDFAAAFAFDFDFQREIEPGDIFEAAIEQKVDADGASVGAERLVYASLQTAEKSRALYRFQPPAEFKPAWYDANGVSTARSLMRTPVEGARISSSFGPRTHPVLGYTRVHKGTDFATPVGTQVFASGDGVVDFVGPHGGHGNYIRIRHSPTTSTAYAHLSGYWEGVGVGTAVKQGQPIARSGNTGLSSGPHLHYEVIVNGQAVDPMTYQTEGGRSLEGEGLLRFKAERDRIDGLRAAQNH